MIGAGAGVVLAGPGAGVAVRVVAELAEHPGAEDLPEPGLADGRSQRPGAGQNAPPPALAACAICGVQRGDHARPRRARWRRRRRPAPPAGPAARRAARSGSPRPWPSTSRRRARVQRRGDPAAGQPRRRAPGPGRAASSSSASAAVRSSKASSAAGKYSRSADRSRSTCRVPFPDQRLVRPGHDLDPPPPASLSPATGRSWCGVGADHVGQHVRVPGVALGPRRGVPLPVAGHLQRVDREHPVARPRPAPSPTGPGRSRSRPAPARRSAASARRRAAPTSACSRAIPATPSGSRALPSRRPALVLHLHVVVVLGPVVPDEQHHRHLLHLLADHRSAACGRPPAA